MKPGKRTLHGRLFLAVLVLMTGVCLVYCIDSSGGNEQTMQTETEFEDEIIFKNLTVSADRDTFLECAFENPTFLDWQKDGKAIEVSNAYQERRVFIIRGEGLLVLNAQYTDSGYYTCIAMGQQMIHQVTVFLVVARSSDNDRPLRDYPIECGVPRLRGKIIGGKVTEKGQAPWMALLWDTKGDTHFCGGVLLNQRWVVTAAHCFNGFEYNIVDYMRVRLGEYDLVKEEGTERNFRVEKLIINPEFVMDTYDSDIALIKLRQPVTYTDYIIPICLPSEMRARNLLQARTRGFITGWGRTAEDTNVNTRYLRRVRLLVMDQRVCNNRYLDVITNRMFCAISDERPTARDSCFGDSGSPFAIRDNRRWYLIGLVSWGIGCARQRYPGVYTRVHRYTRWITSLISDDTDTCEGLQEKVSELTSQLSRQEETLKQLKHQLHKKEKLLNGSVTCTAGISSIQSDSPALDLQQGAPPPELRIPCRHGSCEHVGGYQVRAFCEDEFCVCESPHYSKETCLPCYGSCVIKHDAPSALAKPTYQGEPQQTYSCLSDDNQWYHVYVLAVHEGNRHTRPPVAGDMEVILSGNLAREDARGLVLVLATFEPVNWSVRLHGQLAVQQLILISHFPSTVSITNIEGDSLTDVPTQSMTDPFGYGNDSGGGRDSGDTPGMLRIINATVGPVTSFTGTYRAERWTLTLDESFQRPEPD